MKKHGKNGVTYYKGWKTESYEGQLGERSRQRERKAGERKSDERNSLPTTSK